MRRVKFNRLNWGLLLLLCMWAGCARETAVSPLTNASSTTPLSVAQTPFTASQPCTGQFVTHPLDHITQTAVPVTMFESNGAGLAINDLNNDGLLDIVLANIQGESSLLWNEGNLQFRREPLTQPDARGVAIVDVNGDGWQDITFSTLRGSMRYWQNDNGRFATNTPLPGVRKPAFAFSWGDLDADGDLDLVTGSYDAALEKALGNSFLLGDGAGVFVYENDGDQFVPTRLADQAQALALLLLDVDENGRLDILVGNDFAVRDQLWLNTDAGWEAAEPFAQTTHSTMSFDMGDLNNDGHWELLATDMKPYADDDETLAAWQPVMDNMNHGEIEGDPQHMENVLQVADNDDAYQNLATDFGLEATGWSWSGKFGDLNNDGFLDLYVVNGMAAQELFSHLPADELVEQNQAFINENGQRFATAPDWGLSSELGGRSMSMADFDGDGDLDIVVNNLNAPATLFENQLCGENSIAVTLRWPESQNVHGVGATVWLEGENGRYERTVRTNSGYLSGDPIQLHVGLPQNETISQLVVQWPDGERSTLDSIPLNTHLTLTRTR